MSAGSFTYVGGGLNHTCGVRTDGSVACWGDKRIPETFTLNGKEESAMKQFKAMIITDLDAARKEIASISSKQADKETD
jgi:Regulator of Chromosome Condensation (RCC1) repeat protein